MPSRESLPLATALPDDLWSHYRRAPEFSKPGDEKVAQVAYEENKHLQNEPNKVPTTAHLAKPELQGEIAKATSELLMPSQRPRGCSLQGDRLAGARSNTGVGRTVSP